jgi:hypothetical protein
MKTMVEGHASSSSDEMLKMYSTLYERHRGDLGEMPVFARYKASVEARFRTIR